MNQLNSQPETSETELTAALDKTVEAAFGLRLSEKDLVRLLLQRYRHRIAGNVIKLNVKPIKKLFDPTAGP